MTLRRLFSVIVLSFVVATCILISCKDQSQNKTSRSEQQYVKTQSQIDAEIQSQIQAAKDRKESELRALSEQSESKWGVRPEVLLNEELIRDYGNRLPCPNGWDENCQRIWEKHTRNNFDMFRFNPSEHEDQIVVVNGRIAAPMPCRDYGKLSIETWQNLKLSDPILFFKRKIQKYGKSDDTWIVLAIDQETVEAAIQIAKSKGEVTENEVNSLRQAAIVQLFKPRAKSFILMYNNAANLPRLVEWEPQLISMRHGTGRLVGMSMGIARRLKPKEVGLLMFEDKTCEHDTSYAIRFRAQYYSTYTHEFVFEGTGNLLDVLAKALGSDVAEQKPQEASQQVPQKISPRTGGQTNRMSLGEISTTVGLALNIVRFILLFVK